MAELTPSAPDIEIREVVRERYAAAATAIAAAGAAIADPAAARPANPTAGPVGAATADPAAARPVDPTAGPADAATADPMAEPGAACCGPASAAGSSCCAPVGLTDSDGNEVFGGSLYDDLPDADGAPVQASLGCGVPTAVADLRDGDVVLDLGSGAGADVLISARRVAPSGRAIGLDMTDEMLALARSNAAAAGVENAEFVKGYLEQLPLADASVDVVISNCVLNLSNDKPAVLREAARVLRPGGRFAISDVVADADMDAATRADVAQWTGCVAGALTREEFQRALAAAGFVDVEIRETHRVHAYAGAATVRARKP